LGRAVVEGVLLKVKLVLKGRVYKAEVLVKEPLEDAVVVVVDPHELATVIDAVYGEVSGIWEGENGLIEFVAREIKFSRIRTSWWLAIS
jgi:hypothetical protein